MQDGVNEPPTAAAPVAIRPPTRWRAAALLAIGGVVGLAVGVALTTAVSAYRFLTPTLPLPSDQDPTQILMELNELRHQVNQLNDAKKLQAQQTDDATRRALTTLASMVRARATAAPGAPTAAEKPAAAGPPVRRGYDPFAELDAEIKNLEDTQAILNSILDLFLPAPKEPAKDRRDGPGSPG
jgi:hypothetical protein